ncbi:carboxylesterase family protein, partial [Lactococcus lactis]|uniref:carboxylesterase family protein n=1 Tax=Lactococcus lactis TaxID=1358 RepID=UPI001F471E53
VVKLWTNFAKYGNPTPDYDNPISPTVWEPSGTAGRQLNISDECVMMDRAAGLTSVLAEELFYTLMPIKSGCSSISTNVNFTTTFLSGL